MSGVALAMLGAVSQGVLWGLMVLGVYITYKILDIADLTVDGSFALGGCVCAAMIANKGMNPVLAIFIALLAGLAAGAVTGFLHTVFDIPAILSGILTQIALWSINLRIMSGKSNVPLLKAQTIFSEVVKSTGLTQSQVSLIVGLIIAALMIVFLYWLLQCPEHWYARARNLVTSIWEPVPLLLAWLPSLSVKCFLEDCVLLEAAWYLRLSVRLYIS